MKTSLQLKTTQSLLLTPQLQQAIRLLQLSTLELTTEIQDALESNIMLEVADSDHDNTLEKQQTEVSANSEINQDDIPEELPIDSVWEDIDDDFSAHTIGSMSESRDYDRFENLNSKDKTLHEQLAWQLNLLPISDTDRVIALTIIDSLDDDGYLQSSLAEILATVAENETLEDIGLAEVVAVLHIIQTMEPVGIGARDLQECLHIQLGQCTARPALIQVAQLLVADHLTLLANHDHQQLARKVRHEPTMITAAIDLIQSLNPRPGSKINPTQTEYVVPDVYVKKTNGAWQVKLNGDTIPSLKINATYANMIRRADNSTDNHSLKSHLQEARWLIKNIRSRNETLLRVASCIVERQRGFLEHGEEAMKPLILQDIAKTLDMHESTISRATTHKYIHTPRGIFELKYFFSSQLNADHGNAFSSTAIRAVIKKLIHTEEPKKPLSDSKIVTILGHQGVHVARRTIAKYREIMNIPPSNERKRFL